MQQLVLAIQPHDGKVIWKSEVGSLRQDNAIGGGARQPAGGRPAAAGLSRRSVLRRDPSGVFARLDADSRASPTGDLPIRPTRCRARAAFSSGADTCSQPEADAGRQPAAPIGETFLLKGLQSTRLNAIDPNRMKVLWERPISKGSRLLAADDQHRLSWWRGDLRDRPRRAVSFCGRRGCPVAVPVRRFWCEKMRSGNRRSRGIIELDPRIGRRCGGSSAARTWAPWAAT